MEDIGRTVLVSLLMQEETGLKDNACTKGMLELGKEKINGRQSSLNKRARIAHNQCVTGTVKDTLRWGYRLMGMSRAPMTAVPICENKHKYTKYLH